MEVEAKSIKQRGERWRNGYMSQVPLETEGTRTHLIPVAVCDYDHVHVEDEEGDLSEQHLQASERCEAAMGS